MTERAALAALIVDDNPDDRAFVKREMLRDYPGATVVEACGPESRARLAVPNSLNVHSRT
jgi:hypothetical protein